MTDAAQLPLDPGMLALVDHHALERCREVLAGSAQGLEAKRAEKWRTTPLELRELALLLSGKTIDEAETLAGLPLARIDSDTRHRIERQCRSMAAQIEELRQACAGTFGRAWTPAAPRTSHGKPAPRWQPFADEGEPE